MNPSVVIPIHSEEARRPAPHARLSGVVQGLPLPYARLFVNAGPADRSFAMLLTLAAAAEHVRGIDPSRNFGHQIAVSAGRLLAVGRIGEYIVRLPVNGRSRPLCLASQTTISS